MSAEGNDVYLTLPAGALQARVSGAVSQSIEIVRRRIDSTGTIDPQIARQGEDRISVQLPGISDPQHVKELLGKTAKMTFQLLDDSASTTGTPPPGTSSCRSMAVPAPPCRCAAMWRWTART